MMAGSPQEVATRERAALRSPSWNERHARQAREAADAMEQNGHHESAAQMRRAADALEAEAARLRGEA